LWVWAKKPLPSTVSTCATSRGKCVSGVCVIVATLLRRAMQFAAHQLAPFVKGGPGGGRERRSAAIPQPPLRKGEWDNCMTLALTLLLDAV